MRTDDLEGWILHGGNNAMTVELKILAWTLVLSLVQLFIAAGLRNKETGRAYNIGPRDEPGPPVGKVTGRLQRAHRNLLETLPVFAVAILIAHMANRDGMLTLWGAWLYLVARIVYVPLYAYGVPLIRSLVFLVSVAGIALILIAILRPA
jgi:uncharacterized MAPEG superfamily protein